MPSVSLCMIVKNEEKNIGRCLDSVDGVVNEIIIVDTGSSDNTKKICGEAGAMVYDFAWTGDFAKVRNFGLEKASCDWILWMDADEELLVSDPSALQRLLSETKDILIPVQLIHLYGEDPPDDHRSYRSTGFRLFRNHSGISFTGEIHEKLDAGSLNQSVRLALSNVLSIRHYGYMDSNYQPKATRNLTALLKQKQSRPGDPWIDYYLAAEYHRAGGQEKALEAVNLAIAGFLGKGALPPSLAYKLKYEILVTTESFDSAYPGIDKAIALYPDYVDLHFYKGTILYGKGQYDKAAIAFLYCLILGESHPQYLVMTGAGSFSALYQLGLCYEKQEKLQQASEAYRQAIALYPGYEQAKARLKAISGEN